MTKKTDEYQTTRIWKKTLHRLKLIAALKRSSIVEVIDTLSEQELERIQKGDTRDVENKLYVSLVSFSSASASLVLDA